MAFSRAFVLLIASCIDDDVRIRSRATQNRVLRYEILLPSNRTPAGSGANGIDTLRAAFAYAVAAELIGRSPCRDVNLPKAGKVRATCGWSR